MLLSVRTASVAALAAVFVAYAFASDPNRSNPGPQDPIAADGSLIAGRGRTLADSTPGALAPQHLNSDEPADFAPLLEKERPFAERERALFRPLLGRLEWSLCKDADHLTLVRAVRSYYQERGRQIKQFSFRGPRAKAAVEAEWSTGSDREIDDYVRHALQYGILHMSEVSANLAPEFTSAFAATAPLGSGCAVPDHR